MYFHIILEPQLFHCLNFIVRAEDKQAAKRKLEAWCNHQVETTRKLFAGAKDQETMVCHTRDYWATGLHNLSIMRELNGDPDFDVRAFIA